MEVQGDDNQRSRQLAFEQLLLRHQSVISVAQKYNTNTMQRHYKYNTNTLQCAIEIQKSHHQRDRSVISAPQLSFLALSLWSSFLSLIVTMRTQYDADTNTNANTEKIQTAQTMKTYLSNLCTPKS